jgi:hypothetical protein
LVENRTKTPFIAPLGAISRDGAIDLIKRKPASQREAGFTQHTNTNNNGHKRKAFEKVAISYLFLAKK